MAFALKSGLCWKLVGFLCIRVTSSGSLVVMNPNRYQKNFIHSSKLCNKCTVCVCVCVSVSWCWRSSVPQLLRTTEAVYLFTVIWSDFVKEM